jgi:hypothetical protein
MVKGVYVRQIIKLLDLKPEEEPEELQDENSDKT